MFLIKFTFYFVLSYFILTIPIQNRPIFDHIGDTTGPYTDKIHKITQDISYQGIQFSKKMGLKLFRNSNPKRFSKLDLKHSSIVDYDKKSRTRPIVKLKPQDNYTAEEEELLRKLLKRPSNL